jgi:hypothetical protein
MQHAYRDQFLSKRNESAPSDGRIGLLDQLRKIHRRGPTKPGSLAKRASNVVDDAQIRKMLLTTDERQSNGTDALDSIRKIHARGPTGAGLLLPEAHKASASSAADIGAKQVTFSMRDLATIRRVRKGASGIGLQSSNATDDPPPPSTWGAVDARDVTNEAAPGSQSTSQFGSRHADSEHASLPRQSDQDDDAADEATKAIRALHRQGPKTQPLR